MQTLSLLPLQFSAVPLPPLPPLPAEFSAVLPLTEPQTLLQPPLPVAWFSEVSQPPPLRVFAVLPHSVVFAAPEHRADMFWTVTLAVLRTRDLLPLWEKRDSSFWAA